MKVVIEKEGEHKLINWLAVAEDVKAEVVNRIRAALDRAADEIKELQPGETRDYTIEIGKITISREVEAETETDHEQVAVG